MKSKLAMILIVGSILVASLIAGLQAVEVAEANPASFIQLWGPVNINIQSPQNQTYNTNNVMFNFTVESSIENQPPAHCILNGKSQIDVPLSIVAKQIKTFWTWSGISESNHTFTYAWFIAQGNGVLSNLADGTYNLTIQRSGNAARPLVSANVSFTIDTILPSVQVELENKTYNTNTLPLNFNINEPTSQISYSLDNQANITLAGNTTLTNFADGLHNIIVYATDIAGNVGKSDTILFTVNTATPSPSPTSSPAQQQTLSPTQPMLTFTDGNSLNLLIIGITAVIVAIVIVIVYFKKRMG